RKLTSVLRKEWHGPAGIRALSPVSTVGPTPIRENVRQDSSRFGHSLRRVVGDQRTSTPCQPGRRGTAKGPASHRLVRRITQTNLRQPDSADSLSIANQVARL